MSPEQQTTNTKNQRISSFIHNHRQPLTSTELFGASRLIVIRHSGEEYRLSITSNDKLILTK